MFGYTIIKTSELEAMKASHTKLQESFASLEADMARRRAAFLEVNGRYNGLQSRLDDALERLAHWERHGQLRDPATGRLIPKARATA